MIKETKSKKKKKSLRCPDFRNVTLKMTLMGQNGTLKNRKKVRNGNFSIVASETSFGATKVVRASKNWIFSQF